jgi:hypothetical protein
MNREGISVGASDGHASFFFFFDARALRGTARHVAYVISEVPMCRGKSPVLYRGFRTSRQYVRGFSGARKINTTLQYREVTQTKLSTSPPSAPSFDSMNRSATLRSPRTWDATSVRFDDDF